MTLEIYGCHKTGKYIPQDLLGCTNNLYVNLLPNNGEENQI